MAARRKKKYNKGGTSKHFLVGSFLAIALVLGLTVMSVQRPHDVRQSASGRVAAVGSCGNGPSNVLLVVDRSHQMFNTNKFATAKPALKQFVDTVSQDTANRIGLVTFADPRSTDVLSPLTDVVISVKDKIDTINIAPHSCLQCGINKALQEIQKNNVAGVKPVVILLTDGKANKVESTVDSTDFRMAQQAGLLAAKSAYEKNKVVFYTIGIGPDAKSEILQAIAQTTGGKSFIVRSEDELGSRLQMLAKSITGGIVTGTIFNDANENKKLDATEAKLSDWKTTITGGSIPTNLSATTDLLGMYSITGLCDGAYTLRQTVAEGWSQTVPNDPSTYSFTVAKGSVNTGMNFGNKLNPTPTPTPTPTLTPTPTSTPTVAPTNTPTSPPLPTHTPTLIPVED